jgi:hypothetical protein
MAAPPSPNSKPSCSPAVPPPPVAGAPVGTLLSAGTGVWLVCAGGVVVLGAAGARFVDVGEAVAVEGAVGASSFPPARATSFP